MASAVIRPLSVIFLLIVSCSIGCGYVVNPGPVVHATVGEVWPKPKEQVTGNKFYIIRLTNFQFEATNHTCDILDKAFQRYLRIISLITKPTMRRSRTMSQRDVTEQLDGSRRMRKWRRIPEFDGQLESISVALLLPCESKPHLGMDESYKFVLRDSVGTLESYSIWGILRGLESISQMIHMADDGPTLRINSTKIVDSPRFSHRGLLVDTSRHYVSVSMLYKILDGMAYNKLNVFHWHIVDDHSFPYKSIKFPELSEKGAFHPTRFVYSQEDIRRIVEYARLRGIRVMAEFDTPGHTRSWGNSHPELLTPCHGKYEGYLGPIDPTKESTYAFLNELFQEVVTVFPDQYVHLGGDEVGFECWESNEDILAYMQANNLKTFENLEEKYIQRIVDNIDQLNASSVVWQEVYVNGVQLPPKTVVHVWTGNRYDLLYKITRDGLPALLSTCWYLDHLATGGDWRKFYSCDPHDFNGTTDQKTLVMGGEACMWGEVVDDSNILQRIFPRVSAAAEKLWSEMHVNNTEDAAKRLEEHYCRMRTRGIPAQPPNGPGFC